MHLIIRGNSRSLSLFRSLSLSPSLSLRLSYTHGSSHLLSGIGNEEISNPHTHTHTHTLILHFFAQAVCSAFTVQSARAVFSRVGCIQPLAENTEYTRTERREIEVCLQSTRAKGIFSSTREMRAVGGNEAWPRSVWHITSVFSFWCIVLLR